MVRHLKVLTYNVHGCVGWDRRPDPARIATVIESCQPDIIGLQELDVGRLRSGGADQAQYIASRLRMNATFHPAMHRGEEQYGDAILTSLPAEVVKTGDLPGPGEPRGVIWMRIAFADRRFDVFNTHLGAKRYERMRQLSTLLGERWLGNSACRDSDVILMGDFNAIPSSMGYRQIARKLELARPKERRFNDPTFPSRFPFLRLDHVFLSSGLRCIDARPVRTPLARVASDHLPLRATIALD
ncbi:EEP domain-containing protein [bacterium]|nr:EEP domain-containing protein [bacterium]